MNQSENRSYSSGFKAFGVRGFLPFWLGSVVSILGQQMVSVAMG
ncbi:MAG: hypothetical protein RJA81_917, partial [Planctomycetota bacterium]